MGNIIKLYWIKEFFEVFAYVASVVGNPVWSRNELQAFSLLPPSWFMTGLNSLCFLSLWVYSGYVSRTFRTGSFKSPLAEAYSAAAASINLNTSSSSRRIKKRTCADHKVCFTNPYSFGTWLALTGDISSLFYFIT